VKAITCVGSTVKQKSLHSPLPTRRLCFTSTDSADHGGRAVFGWALRYYFLQPPFKNVVCDNGHWTTLSFGLVIKRRDQMPLDGGPIMLRSGHGFSGLKCSCETAHSLECAESKQETVPCSCV
jgi:hypothetical protein